MEGLNIVTAHVRGNEVYFKDGQWLFVYNDELVTDRVACKKCKMIPTTEGYDACLGYIQGAVSACCGHGVEDSYAVFKNNESYKNSDVKFDRVTIEDD